MAVRSLWILLAALLFALTAFFVKLAGQDFSVWALMLCRSLPGVPVCLLILHRQGRRAATKRPLRHLARCGIGTLSLTLGMLAIQMMPLSLSQALINTSPLWFCLLLLLVERPPITLLRVALLATVATGFAGILLILRPDTGTTALSAALLGLLSGAAGAGADWLNRSLTVRGEPPERVVLYFTLSGTIAGLAGTLTTGCPSVTPADIPVLLGIGAAGTLAQLALTYGWKGGHPILNSVFGFMAIPFSVLLGMSFLGDRPDLPAFAGIAVVTLSGLGATLLERRTEAVDRSLQNTAPRF